MARQRESLTELAFMERELSWLADEAAGRIADPQVAESVRRIRDEHESAAARLSGVLREVGGESEVPEDLRGAVRAMQREVRHARDQDGVLEGMLDAERADLRMHENALDAGLPDDVGRVVREETSARRDHVGFFESVAPAMAPDIRGSRSMPGGGPGAV